MSVDWKKYHTELKSKSIEEIFKEELCPAYAWDDRDAMYYCILELARRLDINLQEWTDKEDERMKSDNIVTLLDGDQIKTMFRNPHYIGYLRIDGKIFSTQIIADWKVLRVLTTERFSTPDGDRTLIVNLDLHDVAFRADRDVPGVIFLRVKNDGLDAFRYGETEEHRIELIERNELYEWQNECDDYNAIFGEYDMYYERRKNDR